MPSNADFTMRILVGGEELPEYEKDGQYYVESNLFTPHSYEFIEEEMADGERVTQKWPVTPYTIQLTSVRDTPLCYYNIFVDGRLSDRIWIFPSETKTSDGFKDNGNIHEYLFSLPRPPRSSEAKCDEERGREIGTIEVECWNARELPQLRHPDTKPFSSDYNHANKNDSKFVTKGIYKMMTTRKGKKLRADKPQTNKLSPWEWVMPDLRSRLAVKYRTWDALWHMQLITEPGTVSNGDEGGETQPGPSDNKVAIKREIASIWNWSDSDDDEVVITDVVKPPKRRRGKPIRIKTELVEVQESQ